MGDHYILVLNQTFAGQQLANVFAYEKTSGTGAAEDLGNDFVTDVLPWMQEVQSTGLSYDSMSIINYDDPADFKFALLVGYTGAVTGEVMPIFTAWGFEYARLTRVIRNGAKRFGGVVMGQVEANEPTGGALTLLEDLADHLATPIDGSVTAIFTPQIMRRAKIVGGTEIWPTSFHAISGVKFTRITTQNTRKLGRGA